MIVLPPKPTREPPASVQTCEAAIVASFHAQMEVASALTELAKETSIDDPRCARILHAQAALLLSVRYTSVANALNAEEQRWRQVDHWTGA